MDGKGRYILILIVISSLFITVGFPKIVLWMSWEGEDWFEKVADSFEKNTGVEVEVVYVPNIWKKLSMSLRGGGDLPDVCLVKNENLESIERYIDLPSLDELGLDKRSFHENILKAFTVDGKVKAVPFYADVQIAYLNVDVFKKLGMNLPNDSWNFEEFVEILKKIKQKDEGITPTTMGLFSPYFFFGLQAGIGSGVSSDGVKVDTEENVKLIELLKKLHDEGLIMNITKKRPIMVKMFIKKELAILPHGSFLIRKFEEKKVNFTIRVLPKPWKGVVDPKGFVVFKNDENVRKFISFLLSNSEDFMDDYRKIPALKNVKLKNKYMSTLLKAVENGVVQPSSVEFEEYWDVMGSTLELAITGKMDPMEALKMAQSYIEGGR
ncbi:MAG: hypothetical protein DRP30_00730 [Thermotoga sp.]|nr:MAG: hypothetical protein DRP30_00730 [Thermotoga sp.]